MKSRENIADILCIGCQKGSTSWLHSVLNCHPATYAFPDSEPVTSTDKEAHYWDWNAQRGADWYRQLLSPQDPAQLSMDFTPEYACLTEAQIDDCKALNPGAKVFYILRDPLARAVSALRMHMLWHLGKDHSEPLKLGPQFEAFAQEARLEEHGDYLRNVTAWRARYPDLILLNYEDFHTDRAASIGAVFAQLGLDADEMDETQKQLFNGLMTGRVWVSEKFEIDRAVLMFLQGLTWQYRQAAEDALGMRFTEGDRMLGR
ncbi:sulfotransferase family protein [Pararhodobacter oceanensis]|uniref:sulfotransferase family protein n=1 Tax=Pararhodobacter oceanensis TaxID=2172121 RepID=UPI003A9566E3